jgi:anthranilate synthase component 2
VKILIIDNYDSFTYNLYQECGALLKSRGEISTLKVVRNDEWTFPEIENFAPEKIIISPGPGDPQDVRYFGVCAQVIKLANCPVLGICLGMQGMGYVFGGKVIRASLPMHGKTSLITHDGKGVFAGLPQEIEVMRYHSLIIEESSLPQEFEISARSHDGEIMGIRHKQFPLEGVQFHPESYATEGGREILRNFILS